MGYAERYLALTDELQIVLSALLGIKDIVFEEKERIGELDFPALFVLTGDDNIEEMPGNVKKHNFEFELVLVVKDSDIEAGKRKVIELSGNVHDVLLDNRRLNGKAKNLSVIKIAKPVIYKDQGVTLHYRQVNIKVTALWQYPAIIDGVKMQEVGMKGDLA